MLASFVIGFRESLEAALIVGVILAYLNKTNRTRYNYLVYIGIASAVLMSIILALIFNSLVGDFKGIAGELFEGSVMLLASIILTYVILWMMKQRHIRDNLEHKIDVEIKKKHKIGLFSLSFIAVLREGAETILFLGAAGFVGDSLGGVGVLLGIFLAIFVGYLLFVGTKKINIKSFFTITSFLLILFATHLFASGIHEFQEAGVILTTVGPSLVKIVSYSSYLALVYILYRSFVKKVAVKI